MNSVVLVNGSRLNLAPQKLIIRRSLPLASIMKLSHRRFRVRRGGATRGSLASPSATRKLATSEVVRLMKLTPCDQHPDEPQAEDETVPGSGAERPLPGKGRQQDEPAINVKLAGELLQKAHADMNRLAEEYYQLHHVRLNPDDFDDWSKLVDFQQRKREANDGAKRQLAGEPKASTLPGKGAKRPMPEQEHIAGMQGAMARSINRMTPSAR